jgi:hypothetical protein
MDSNLKYTIIKKIVVLKFRLFKKVIFEEIKNGITVFDVLKAVSIKQFQPSVTSGRVLEKQPVLDV